MALVAPHYTRTRFRLGAYWRNLDTDTDERNAMNANPNPPATDDTDDDDMVINLEIGANGIARLSWPGGGTTLPAKVAKRVFPDLGALRDNDVQVTHY